MTSVALDSGELGLENSETSKNSFGRSFFSDPFFVSFFFLNIFFLFGMTFFLGFSDHLQFLGSFVDYGKMLFFFDAAERNW